MKKWLWLWAALANFLFSNNARGQDVRGFYGGYGFGSYLDGLRNLEIEATRYNNSGGRTMKQPLDISPFYSGFVVGYYIDMPETKIGFDISWTNRHNEATAITEAQGTEYTINVKHRLNTVGFGMYYIIGKSFRLGFAPDIGDFSVLQKAAPTSEYSAAPYKAFYQESSTLATGVNIFAILQTKLGKKTALSFRPYLRIDEFETTMMDNTSTINYVFRLSTIGVNVALVWSRHANPGVDDL